MLRLSAMLVPLLTGTVACGDQGVRASAAASDEAPLAASSAPVPENTLSTVPIESSAQIMPPAPGTGKPDACPGLESALFQLTQAEDPLHLAGQLGLRVKGDKIQVLLILEREDTSFLDAFDVELGTQSGTQAQAFVPIQRLCDLARTDEVLAIRLSGAVVPQ